MGGGLGFREKMAPGDPISGAAGGRFQSYDWITIPALTSETFLCEHPPAPNLQDK